MLCVKLYVIISQRLSKRSRPHLLNDSVYERAGNNSFKQLFVHIQYLLTIFWSNQDVKPHLVAEVNSDTATQISNLTPEELARYCCWWHVFVTVCWQDCGKQSQLSS